MARSIPIRHGLAIAHAHTSEDAVDLTVALQSRSKIQAPSTGLDLSSVAAASAKSCLEAICADIPKDLLFRTLVPLCALVLCESALASVVFGVSQF